MSARTKFCVFASSVLYATSCGGVPVGDALHAKTQAWRLEAHNTLAVVDVYTVEDFVVLRDVRLEAATPIDLPAGVEVVDSRVTFVDSNRHSRGRMLGVGCTDRWPPNGFSGTLPLKGIGVAKGEQFAVNLYVRAQAPGHWVLRGIDLTYRDGSRTFHQRSEKLIVSFIRKKTVGELPKGDRSCTPIYPNPFFRRVSKAFH